jgi:hypothetical protein
MAKKAKSRSTKELKKQIQVSRTHTWARSVELGLIFTSLFWAVEVNANQNQIDHGAPGIDRLPAHYLSSLKKLGPGFNLNSSVPQRARSIPPSPHAAGLRLETSQIITLSPTFKSIPEYVPSIVVLGRFSTPK